MVLSQRFVGYVGCKERGLRELCLRHFDNLPLRNGAATVALLFIAKLRFRLIPGWI